jgi:hypothetical protein
VQSDEKALEQCEHYGQQPNEFEYFKEKKATAKQENRDGIPGPAHDEMIILVS